MKAAPDVLQVREVEKRVAKDNVPDVGEDNGSLDGKRAIDEPVVAIAGR